MQNRSSRRTFFRYMAIFGVATFYSSPLHAKTSKETVKYQETPKDGNRCESCLHFLPETNECRTVAGAISPDGWCSIYFKHPNYKPRAVQVETNENNETNASTENNISTESNESMIKGK